MSDKLICLYAENLKGNDVGLTIEKIRSAPERIFAPGKNEGSEAWDVIFKEQNSEGNSVYIQIPARNKHGKATGLLRQYNEKCGGDPSEEHVGTKITLYPVKSARAATGKAIRIRC